MVYLLFVIVQAMFYIYLGEVVFPSIFDDNHRRLASGIEPRVFIFVGWSDDLIQGGIVLKIILFIFYQ